MKILDPRVHFDDDAESATFDLGAPLAGANVGLRLDRSWRSYFVVIDEWKQRLVAEGANVHVLYTGERVGSEGETTRSDLDEWSRLVDCAVVGLGN